MPEKKYPYEMTDRRHGDTPVKQDRRNPYQRDPSYRPPVQRRFAVRGWMIAGALFALAVLAIVGRLAGWW